MKAVIEEVHLRDYLRVLLVHRWIFAGVLVLVMASVSLYVFLKTPEYRAEGILLIEPTKLNLTEFKGIYDPTLQMGGAMARREFYETQYELIVSRDLLEQTFEKFAFGQHEKFREAKDAIKDFRKLFDVNPVRRSRLVTVSFDWTDPELAARVLDHQMEAYITDYRNRNYGVTTTGLNALREKAEELRPKVEAKSSEIQRFVANAEVVSLEKTENIIIDRLRDISRSLAEVERKRMEYESIYSNIQQAVRDDRSIADMPEVAMNQAIRDLKLEYIRLQQDLSELAKRFGPNHPEVRTTVARLKTTKAKLKQEIGRTLASAKANLDRIQRQERDLRADMEAQEKRVMGLNKQSARYSLMQDSYGTLRKTYNALVKRIDEIEVTMAAGSREDNIFIINHPRVPVEPVRPRKALSLALALVASLFSGGALCFLIEYLDTTVKTKEDLQRIVDAPLIGYIPALEKKEISRQYRKSKQSIELVPVEFGRTPLAEAFRSIRTALSFSASNGESRCLQVTSAMPSEGKTITSVNLAIAVARSGKRVLLIDADMRKPRIHGIFRISSKPGLSNVLADHGVKDISDTIKRFEKLPTLHVMPSGVIPPNPAELLASDRMTKLIETVKGNYDQIIIDTPPVGIVTDGVVVAGMVQATVLVVRAFSTHRHILSQSLDTLAHAGARVVGVVFNYVDMPRRGYYYSSYYYQKSGYYGGVNDAATEDLTSLKS